MKPNESAQQEIWVVEGNFMKRGWKFCFGSSSHAEADHYGKRFTAGLKPVWRYRVVRYVPDRKAKP